METVILKNGSEEVKSLVAVTMLSLQTLMDTKPLVFYDLVMVCRDSAYRPFGNARQELNALGLWMSHETAPHDSIRNVVLSAVSGDGLDMTLGSPT